VIPTEARSIARVRVTPYPSGTSIDRTLEARPPGSDVDLASVTWNDQPSTGEVLAREMSNEDPHRWDSEEAGSAALLDHVDARFQNGDDVFQLVLQDESEGATLGLNQVYEALESGSSDPRVQFWISEFAHTDEIGSRLLAAHASDLPTTLTPILVEDVPTTVNPWNNDLPTLTSIAAVQAVPIEDDHEARAVGRVSIRLENELDDVQAIVDEVASPVTVDGDDVRAIVQQLDAHDEPFPPHAPPIPPACRAGTPSCSPSPTGRRSHPARPSPGRTFASVSRARSTRNRSPTRPCSARLGCAG
jgi:hypothetical protein